MLIIILHELSIIHSHQTSPGQQQLPISWGWDGIRISNKEIKSVDLRELVQLGVTAARRAEAAECNLFEMWVKFSK